MKWTQRGEGRFTAKLGSGLNLHVFKTTVEEDVRRDLQWIAEVFGIMLPTNFRTLAEAHEAAEIKAVEILKSACAECGLRVLEEKE